MVTPEILVNKIKDERHSYWVNCHHIDYPFLAHVKVVKGDEFDDFKDMMKDGEFIAHGNHDEEDLKKCENGIMFRIVKLHFEEEMLRDKRTQSEMVRISRKAADMIIEDVIDDMRDEECKKPDDEDLDVQIKFMNIIGEMLSKFHKKKEELGIMGVIVGMFSVRIVEDVISNLKYLKNIKNEVAEGGKGEKEDN